MSEIEKQVRTSGGTDQDEEWSDWQSSPPSTAGPKPSTTTGSNGGGAAPQQPQVATPIVASNGGKDPGLKAEQGKQESRSGNSKPSGPPPVAAGRAGEVQPSAAQTQPQATSTAKPVPKSSKTERAETKGRAGEGRASASQGDNTRVKIPENLTYSMSPWEKFRKYGKFPMKMTLHALILLFMLIQVYGFQQSENRATDEQRFDLINKFMPPGYETPRNGQDYVARVTAFFFSVSDVEQFINSTVQKYYATTEEAWADYRFRAVEDVEGASSAEDYAQQSQRGLNAFRRGGTSGESGWRFHPEVRLFQEAGVSSNENHTVAVVAPPKMVAKVSRFSPRFRLTAAEERERTQVFDLTPEHPFGIFEASSTIESVLPEEGTACDPRIETAPASPGILGLEAPFYYSPCRPKTRRNIFDTVTHVEIQFSYLLSGYDAFTDSDVSFRWDLKFFLDFREGALVPLTLSVVSADWQTFRPNATFVITVLILILSFFDLALRIKSTVTICGTRRRRQEQLQRRKARRMSLRRRGLDSDEDSSGSGTPDGDGANNGEGSGSNESMAVIEPTAGTTAENDESAPSLGDLQPEASVTLKRMNTVALRQKEKRKRHHKTWREKLASTMGLEWAVLGVISNLLILTFCVLDLTVLLPDYVSPSSVLFHIRNMSQGVAVLASFVLAIMYLRYFPRVYYLVRATSVALPHLGYFLVSVLPIFVGFTFFATIVYGSFNPQYASFLEAATALYSSLFGDSLLQSFQTSERSASFWIIQSARIFCFCFIALFMWVILNIALAIVVDSYEHVRGPFGFFDPNHYGSKNVKESHRLLEQIHSTKRLKVCACQELYRQLALLEDIQSSSSGGDNSSDEDDRTEGHQVRASH
jgi:hypothetical protein